MSTFFVVPAETQREQCIIFLYLVNNLHLVEEIFKHPELLLSFGVIVVETTINICFLCARNHYCTTVIFGE
jgi:hypothetical protein